MVQHNSFLTQISLKRRQFKNDLIPLKILTIKNQFNWEQS